MPLQKKLLLSKAIFLSHGRDQRNETFVWPQHGLHKDCPSVNSPGPMDASDLSVQSRVHHTPLNLVFSLLSILVVATMGLCDPHIQQPEAITNPISVYLLSHFLSAFTARATFWHQGALGTFAFMDPYCHKKKILKIMCYHFVHIKTDKIQVEFIIICSSLLYSFLNSDFKISKLSTFMNH